MGWPHTAWTLAGYRARGSSEIIGSRLVEVLKELMVTIRLIALFAEGWRGTGMQLLLSSMNVSSLPFISGKKKPKHCEPICVFRYLNTFFNTFILNGLNTCLEQAGE